MVLPGDEPTDATFPCPWCAKPVPRDTEAAACPACAESLVVCGKYRIVGHAARTVFRGTRVTDRHPVAIKIVAAPSASAAGAEDDWTAWELFERSCKVLEQLHHRALPKVYAFERTDKGSLVLVREDFDGGTLQERVRDGDERLSRDQVSKLLRDLLELLVYLQGRVPAVIHRDIKPSNIMFRGKDSLEPVLVDFDTIVSRRSGLTIVGTPGYAAPEQFAAESVPASDVYGVGATMLFVATHVEPDDLPRNAGRFEVGDRLEPLGDDLRRVVLRMLEPDLSKRYATAAEALDELRHPPKRKPKPAQEAAPRAPARKPVPSAKSTSPSTANPKPPAKAWLPVLFILTVVFFGVRAGVNKSLGKKSKPAAVAPAPGKKIATTDTHGNLALESDCRGGDGVSCFNLGVRYDYGNDGLEVDHEQAMTYYVMACDHDHPDGCNNLGAGYAKGVGVAKDSDKAAALYAKACKLKSELGCSNLAWFYAEGTSVPKDPKKALEYRDRACDLGNADACNRAGVMYEEGDGVTADDHKAASYYGLACDHDYAWGCRNYGLAYRDGQGVDQDDRRAVALFKRACDKEPNACYLLGKMVLEGRGTEKDPTHAFELFDQACKDKSFDACAAAGEAYQHGEGVKQSSSHALDLFEQACDGGVARGCGDLAGVESDPARAPQLRADACDGGDTRSCAKKR